MNLTRNPPTNWLSAIGYRLSAIGYRLILGVLVACLSWQVQAACTFFDEFKDNNDGTVTDPRNGLIWKQCAEGFKVNGWNGCKGYANPVDWHEAVKIAT